MFFAVVKAIGITIGFVRICAMGKFFAIVDTIAITVRFAWIRSGKAFFGVGKSIAVLSPLVSATTPSPQSDRPLPECLGRLKDQCQQRVLRHR